MTGREIFECMRQGKMPPRIPFVPTIYEHSARIIGKTPSKVAQDESLIVEGQLAAYNLYKHDLISIGVDIYNIEVEALGAKVNFLDNEEIPSVNDILIQEPSDLAELKIPHPEKDGRMPVFLNAAEKIQKEIGSEVVVNGTIVGPFTLAAILRGFEAFIMDLLFDTEFAVELMMFAQKVSLAFADAFIKRGVGISINESWISPPLLSPDLYKNYVFEIEQNMIDVLKSKGLKNVALISGGNTTEIAPYMVKTGTSLLMADYNTDQNHFKQLCKKENISLRASIESKLVENGTTDELEVAVKKVVENCADYNRFIFGCGVVSYNTSPEKVINLKNILQKVTPIRNIV